MALAWNICPLLGTLSTFFFNPVFQLSSTKNEINLFNKTSSDCGSCDFCPSRCDDAFRGILVIVYSVWPMFRDGTCVFLVKNSSNWVQYTLTSACAGLDGSDERLTGDQAVAGSTPTGSATFFGGDLIMKYFLRSFSLPFADSRRRVVSFW